MKEEVCEPSASALEEEKKNSPPVCESSDMVEEDASVSPTLFSSLLQPPSTLISETISRYRQNELFKGAFYLAEEEQYKPHDKVQELLNEDDEEIFTPSLQAPKFISEMGASNEDVSPLSQEAAELAFGPVISTESKNQELKEEEHFDFEKGEQLNTEPPCSIEVENEKTFYPLEKEKVSEHSSSSNLEENHLPHDLG